METIQHCTYVSLSHKYYSYIMYMLQCYKLCNSYISSCKLRYIAEVRVLTMIIALPQIDDRFGGAIPLNN